MDEEKNPQETNDFKTKETVANQLDSFINPNSKARLSSNSVSYYSGSGIKTEPLVKIADAPETEKKQIKPVIRTYKSDVEETIQTSHISSVNMAIAENRKMMAQARESEIDQKKSKINKISLITIIVLIIGGAAVLFVPQLIVNMQNKEVATSTSGIVSSQPIMTTDLDEKLNIADINLDRISTTLKERVNQSATKLGQIKNIYLTEGTGTNEKEITASKFLTLINATLPSEIQRTLKDPFMFGLYNYNGNQRFLILKVGSYDVAFSGMLSWETNLWQDFKELFDLKDDEDNASSSIDSFITSIKKFQDATFNNKDCRVVRNAEGQIIFLYSIIDENTVVITTSTDTLKEIINRISKARIVTQ